MRAALVTRTGPPEVIEVAHVDPPEPGAGEVLVRVEAAGVNFIDTLRRSGAYSATVPFVLGSEAGGVVEALGPGVESFAVGERVAGTGFAGAYAELAVSPADRLIPVPDGVSTVEAAAVALQGMTAHYLATAAYDVRPGDIALIHAAAGGVGNLLVQLCKLRGADVIGVVSTPEKASSVAAAGVLGVVCTAEEDFRAGVERLTDGRGVDVVYDGVGRTTFLEGFQTLRTRGTMVLYGLASGPVDPVDVGVLGAKSLSLVRPSSAHYTATREELLERAGSIFDLVADGTLNVAIDRQVPLELAAASHRALEERQTQGKVLLQP